MQRISRVFVAACALFAAACSDSTEPPAPTTIVLSSTTVSLDALGASQTLTATVKDQHDQPMPAATVTWTSSNAAITVVPSANAATATITSALNGEAVITASSGKASANVKVVVAQAPASLQVFGGNTQVGVVNAPLFSPVGVKVLDRMGAPVAGQVVTFSVAQGGGTTSTPTATTNGEGAAYVTWTLGRSTSQAQQLVATLGALTPATFTAAPIAAAPAHIAVTAGDGQTSTVGTSLAIAPSVRVTDTYDNPVSAATVSFSPNSGSVAVPSATTNDAGIASSGLWTLGATPGAKTLTASVNGVTISLGATALAGAPVTIVVVAGDGQSATVGTQVPVAPSVKVLDAFSNALPSTQVTFSVTTGGGAIAGASTVTNASGVATLGSWTLGPTPGANALTASAGTTASVTINATGTAPGGTIPSTPTATVVSNSVTTQAAAAGAPLAQLPSVLVRDASGNPMAGVGVTFTLTAGGGSISGPNAVTNASGIATLGGWTIGTPANVNSVTAAVNAANVTGGPITFTVAGCEGGGGAGYAITVCYRTPMTATQRQAFVSAAAKWSTIITSDVPDLAVNIGQSSCDSSSPALNMVVDDLVIFAGIEPIDGVGAILGSAGWCYRRTAGLPIIGTMRFDVADVAALEAGGRLNSVILHEMGHVVGIGTMWTAKGLLQLPSTSTNSLDTYFSGVGGIAGFNSIGGLTYTGGQKVPVENSGGAGTMNAHWRESVLANELMTGYLNTGSNPLSLLTIRSLEDIGYSVNTAAADPFALALSLRSSLGGDPGALDLSNDIYSGKQSTIDTRGSIVRIR